MIHEVREKSIKDLESSIDLDVFLRVHEHEQHVEKILPHIVLLVVYCSSDFNYQVADLMDHGLVGALRNCFKQLILDESLSIRGESLPQIFIIDGISDVLGVNCSKRNVSPKDDGGKGLHI